MSDTMEEGVIASWIKKVGDDVKSGEVLAEVETDKATMELESFENGTLLYLGVVGGSERSNDIGHYRHRRSFAGPKSDALCIRRPEGTTH